MSDSPAVMPDVLAKLLYEASEPTELKPPIESHEPFGYFQKQEKPPINPEEDISFEDMRPPIAKLYAPDAATASAIGSGYQPQPETFGEQDPEEMELENANAPKKLFAEGIHRKTLASLKTPTSEPTPEPTLAKRETTITPKTPEKIPALTETFTHKFRQDDAGDVWRDKVDGNGVAVDTFPVTDNQEICKALLVIMSESEQE